MEERRPSSRRKDKRDVESSITLICSPSFVCVCVCVPACVCVVMASPHGIVILLLNPCLLLMRDSRCVCGSVCACAGLFVVPNQGGSKPRWFQGLWFFHCSHPLTLTPPLAHPPLNFLPSSPVLHPSRYPQVSSSSVVSASGTGLLVTWGMFQFEPQDTHTHSCV